MFCILWNSHLVSRNNLLFGNFSETRNHFVNNTWLITSELANQRARKTLFTCAVFNKQISFCRASVCTLITHRWRQNMVRTKKYATSRRRVAWLMFLPCFDVLCALSGYRPTAKWNLFVLYNNQDFWPHFVSELHVEWAESKTFKQSCDPLNYRIILKNFTNNNFKTNLYSGRNFGP